MPKLTGKNVLVTGGAGFIGSHVTDHIIDEQPTRLVVVDNFFLGKKENLSNALTKYPQLKIITENSADYVRMKEIVVAEGIDIVFNLAVIPLPASLEKPRWSIQQNVGIALTMCELAYQGYFKTLVHFSSSEVYGTAQYTPMDETHPLLPRTPYAAAKAAEDHVVLSYQTTFGIDAVIIRPFNNFGPRQNDQSYAGVIPIAITNVLQNKPITIYGDGEQTRDFVFVRDVADAAVRVYENIETRGLVLNVASGSEISVNRLVRDIGDIMGADVEILHGSERPGDVRRHFGDVARAKDLIGFIPRTSWRDGLRETIDWYRESLVEKDGGGGA